MILSPILAGLYLYCMRDQFDKQLNDDNKNHKKNLSYENITQVTTDVQMHKVQLMKQDKVIRELRQVNKELNQSISKVTADNMKLQRERADLSYKTNALESQLLEQSTTQANVNRTQNEVNQEFMNTCVDIKEIRSLLTWQSSNFQDQLNQMKSSHQTQLNQMKFSQQTQKDQLSSLVRTQSAPAKPKQD